MEIREDKMEPLARLAGAMSHDFNNILGAIEGYAALILAGLAPDDPMKQDLEEILKAEQRGAAIARQLQLFSRRYSPRKTKTDVNALVAGLERSARGLFGEKIILRAEPAQGLKQVYADPKPLEQALMNLLVNSAEAMPEGGTVTVKTWTASFPRERSKSAEPPPDGVNYSAISVSDTGPGMAEDVMRRLFEPFFTTKPKKIGRGLGLAAVYGVVKQYNGWLDVQSSPGSGSVFSIYFPQARD